ncbi:MAG: response regulator transcription factor [Chloroflexi bacterium]|nr:response regulator transcription factor [Chloroflexota bacterium]
MLESDDPPGRSPTPEERLRELTPRQVEVLQLVAQGLSYKQVARALFVTERTVKFHVGEITSRLRLKHRREAIALARRAGLISDDASE